MSQGTNMGNGGSLQAPVVTAVSADAAVPRPNFVDENEQDVVNHPLHCSICCDISFDPIITPCQHVFCRDCIEGVLRGNSICPNDRRALSRSTIQDISGLHEYIYNRTLVQCPSCKNWKGILQLYKLHITTCISASHAQSLEQQLKDLKRRHAREIANLQTSNNNLKASLTQERQLNRNLKAEKESLQQQNDRSKSTISALESRILSMGPIFDTNYQYDESNISDLSRIISRYLYNKPEPIDSNRIFHCIQKCYDVARRHHTRDMYLSVKMLLITSSRSNWFPPNQQIFLEEWYSNIPVNL